MTGRRAFLAGAAALLALPRAAEAQPAATTPRIGVLVMVSPTADLVGPEPKSKYMRAFVAGLRQHGYVEGRNLALEVRSAEGRRERFGDLVAELVRSKVQLIVTSAGAPSVRRALDITTTVPIVTVAVGDPVGSGLVQSLARPGGNVTGLTADLGQDLEGKRLELFNELVPRAARMAFLGWKADWDGPWGQRARAAAAALGVALILAEANVNDYDTALTTILRERADAIYVASNAHHWGRRETIVAFARRHGLPDSHFQPEPVEIGGLMAYGPDLVEPYRLAAGYVDKILKGARPAELPMQQPTKFELVINRRTAQALGVTIPVSLAARADRLIE